MTNSTFTVSQELVIEAPEPSKALPVSHHEWSILKDKIKLFQNSRSFVDSFGWKDLGMLFLGVALATFISLWLPGYVALNFKVIAWVVIISCLLLGGCFIFFQYQLDKKNDEKSAITAESILEIMSLIEANRTCLIASEE
jgi:hypothetical protein